MKAVGTCVLLFWRNIARALSAVPIKPADENTFDEVSPHTPNAQQPMKLFPVLLFPWPRPSIPVPFGLLLKASVPKVIPLAGLDTADTPAEKLPVLKLYPCTP